VTYQVTTIWHSGYGCERTTVDRVSKYFLNLSRAKMIITHDHPCKIKMQKSITLHIITDITPNNVNRDFRARSAEV
jgi:hypothetical protein